MNKKDQVFTLGALFAFAFTVFPIIRFIVWANVFVKIWQWFLLDYAPVPSRAVIIGVYSLYILFASLSNNTQKKEAKQSDTPVQDAIGALIAVIVSPLVILFIAYVLGFLLL